MTFDEQALCRGVDPEVFFPTARPNTVIYERELAQAKAVCAVCPVRAECLEWAVETGQDYGVWGGLDPAERRLVKGRLAKAS